MLLWSLLTTIPKPGERPVKVADLGFRVGTKVTIPHLDSRTCDGISLDMHDPVVDKLMEYGGGPVPIRDKTLALGLKVYYRNRVAFHGPLSVPEYDFATGKVELSAHDPSLRLKRALVVLGDIALTTGVTLDGEGLLTLLDAAQNTPAQDALGWPVLGMVRGKDTTTEAEARMKFQRLDKAYQAMKDIADLFVGPDFVWQPFETDPAELASGTDDASPGSAIPDNATTDYNLVVTRTGNIGGLRLGIWAEHSDPQDLLIDLVHPDGTTLRIYNGTKDHNPSGSDFLGTGATTGTLCIFKPGGTSIYAAGEIYPHVGTFRSDRSLAALLDKPAAGTWKLRITDTTADGDTGTLHYFRLSFDLPDPAYCRMNVSDKPDTDALSNAIDPAGIQGPSCIFHKGHGQDNARILTVRPRGDLVVDQFVATSKAGTKIRVNDTARADYGTYQGADSPGENASPEALAAWASTQVGAYSRPIPELDLAPRDDTGRNNTLRYGEDFEIGGHVRAIGKRGHAYWDVLARITRVVLTQQKSSVRTDLDVVPVAAAAAELADG